MENTQNLTVGFHGYEREPAERLVTIGIMQTIMPSDLASDSVEDLQVLTRTDIDLLRQALAANRRVYRIKALAAHDVDISLSERSALDNLLSTTIRALSVVHALRERKADLASPSLEDAGAPVQSHHSYH